jgi:acetoin utilization protein AcuB
MTHVEPTIRSFMTPAPHTIGIEQTVATASRMMKQHDIRHLPVLHGGKIVGVLSERDVALIETFKELDPHKVTVEDAMSQIPYVAAPDTPINQVARDMAEHKYGSTIVVEHGKVIGVFTTMDACRALAETLESRFP